MIEVVTFWYSPVVFKLLFNKLKNLFRKMETTYKKQISVQQLICLTTILDCFDSRHMNTITINELVRWILHEKFITNQHFHASKHNSCCDTLRKTLGVYSILKMSRLTCKKQNYQHTWMKYINCTMCVMDNLSRYSLNLKA